MSNWISRGRIARRTVLVLAALPVIAGAAQDIRVVTYNTQDDVGNNQTLTDANLATVLEGVGQQKYTGDGILQLPDIIALQETYNNATTVVNVTSNLNKYYTGSQYNFSSYQATYYGSGPLTGNGPNALIYNQTTLKLMASVGVGTPQGIVNGEYRQIMRYEFQPISDAGTGTGIFYVYDTHSKSGGASSSTTSQGMTSTNGVERNLEAQIIRNDEASSLSSTASVLYVGDFNEDGTTETAYQTLTAAAAPNKTVQGAAVDPLNPTDQYNLDYTANSMLSFKTDSDVSLHYRDDIQFMTSNVYNGGGGTIAFVPNSFHAFGNNGGTLYEKTVNNTANTALNDITGNGPLTPSVVFNAMNASAGSDHLAVVADYSVVTPIANGIWSGGVGNWSSASMWSNSVVPNSATVEVKIDNANPVASTVTLDQVATVQDITIDAGDTLNIGAAYSLTISSSAASSFNGTFNNTGTLSATTVNNTGVFTSTGTFSATGNFTNSGTATFGGTQNWALASMLVNTTGTLTFNSDAGSSTGANLNVNVSGGSVVFSASQHLASLSLAGGTTATSTQQSDHSSHTLLTTGSLTIAGSTDNWAASLDLTSNDLDVQNGALSDVTNQVKQGFNGGQWNGTGGILSSAAAADSAHLTALGVIQNNQNATPIYGPSNLFDGAAVGAGDILVKFTYFGDANLDGVVDGSDYSLIDNGFLTGATGWFNGDFNYDGVVNGSDYTLIDNAFNMQGASLESLVASTTAQIGGASTVPEPALAGGLVVVAMLGRRRRSHIA